MPFDLGSGLYFSKRLKYLQPEVSHLYWVFSLKNYQLLPYYALACFRESSLSWVSWNPLKI